MILLPNKKSSGVYSLLYTIVCFATLIISGCCLPVKRTELLTNSSDRRVVISTISDEVVVNIAVQTPIEIGKSIIDTDRSFATSPSNKKFLLDVRPNEYRSKSDSTHSLWTADFINLVNPINKNSYTEWKDGLWKLDLYLVEGSPSNHIHIEFHLKSSLYCPAIHGPPN